MVMQGAGELVMKPASARAIERGPILLAQGTLKMNRTAAGAP